MIAGLEPVRHWLGRLLARTEKVECCPSYFVLHSIPWPCVEPCWLSLAEIFLISCVLGLGMLLVLNCVRHWLAAAMAPVASAQRVPHDNCLERGDPCVQVPVSDAEGCKGQDISAPTMNPLSTNVCTTTKVKLLLAGHLTSVVTIVPVWLARPVMNAVYQFAAGWGYPSIEDVQDVRVLGDDGHHVPMRVYTPGRSSEAENNESSAPRKVPVLLFMHGGAFISGNLDTHDHVCRILAHETGYVTVAVDYRLSPEHSGHAAVNDSMAAYKWIHRMGRELHGGECVEPHVIVTGDSAGGLLTCSLCMKLHLERERMAEQGHDPSALPPIPFMQVPLYPPASATSNYPSHSKYGKGWMLSEMVVKYAIGLYFGGRMNQHDPVLVPLMAPLKDLACMPPTLLFTAEHDYLHDEGIAYARRLHSAGGRCEHWECVGMIHGFLNFTGLNPRALDCARRIAQLIKTKVEQGSRLETSTAVRGSGTQGGGGRKQWMDDWHSWLQPNLISPQRRRPMMRWSSMPVQRSETELSFASTPRREDERRDARSDVSLDDMSSSDLDGEGIRPEQLSPSPPCNRGGKWHAEEAGASEPAPSAMQDCGAHRRPPKLSPQHLHAVSLQNLLYSPVNHGVIDTWSGSPTLAPLPELPRRPTIRSNLFTHSAPAWSSVWETDACERGSDDGREAAAVSGGCAESGYVTPPARPSTSTFTPLGAGAWVDEGCEQEELLEAKAKQGAEGGEGGQVAEALELEWKLLEEKRELEEVKLKRVALAMALCQNLAKKGEAGEEGQLAEDDGSSEAEQERRRRKKSEVLCDKARQLQEQAKQMMVALETEINDTSERLEAAVGLMEQFEAGGLELCQGTEDAARKMVRLIDITRSRLAACGRICVE